VLNPDQLYPVQRYYDGFMALRSHLEDPADGIVVAAIVGIPLDGSWNEGESLDRLRELQQISPTNPNELVPSCQTDRGLAFPPVRIVDLVYRFGNNGILASICDDDWTPALEAITRKIQSKITGHCMPRPLASTDPGVCRVVETLVNADGCPHPADADDESRSRGWHVDLGLDEDGRRLCEILPTDYNGDECPDGISREDCQGERFGLDTAALQGWFYDSGSCDFGQVRFTSTDVTSDRSRIAFECRTALCPLRRQCGSAITSAATCDPFDSSTCDGVCLRHNDAETCGTNDDGSPRICGRCVPTLEDSCSRIAEQCSSDPGHEYLYRCDEPLIQEGGCCAEGFHCENGECQADRTTACR
jgi:hypothetical protein